MAGNTSDLPVKRSTNESGAAHIALYEGISNGYISISAQAGQKAGDALAAARPDIDISRCLFMIAGRAVKADYILMAGDIVFVREMAGVTGCMIAMGVIGIVSAVASLGMAVYSAVQQQKMQKEAEKAQRAAKAMSEQVKQLPFLKGAQNRVALGYNIPFVMGRMYDVPYKLTSGCYRLSGNYGEVQEWLCAFVAGYAPLDIEQIKAGSEVLYGVEVKTRQSDNEHIAITISDGIKQTTAAITLSIFVREEVQKEKELNGHWEWQYKYDKGTTMWRNVWVYDGGYHYEYTYCYYTHLAYTVSKPLERALCVKVPVNGEEKEFTIGAGEVSGNSGEWQTRKGIAQVITGEAVIASPYKSIHDVEVREAGDFAMPSLAPLNEKITATSYGDEIPHKAGDGADWQKGLVKQCEQNTYKIEVCIMFEGLRHFDNGWRDSSCSVRLDWSNNGGGLWQTGARWDITANANKTIRFSRTVQFTAMQCFNKDISVRLVRESAQANSNGQDACYLCYINCYQYDAAKSNAQKIVPCMPLELPWRDLVVRIGIRIESSPGTKDILDEINCIAQGKARVWSAASKSWSAMKAATRNPAAWVLEVLTSDAHQASKMDDSEIDLAALGALYERCQTMGFKCDGLVTEDTKKSDLIAQILSECGATMFVDANGLWSFAIEGAQKIPVALLNEDAIVSITASKDFSRKPFALKATYTNRQTWAMETCYMTVRAEDDALTGAKAGEVVTGAEAVMALRGGDKSKVITEASFKYATEWAHISILMRRQLAKLRLQLREISVAVGAEGDFYPLYALVLLQTKRLAIGISSGLVQKIKTGRDAIILETSDICVFNSASEVMGIVIQTASLKRIYLKVMSAGGLSTRQVYITGGDIAKIADITAGDIYSFGELDEDGEFTKLTQKMQIIGVKQSTTGWELTLRDYSDALYENEGNIPEYKSNITMPRESTGSVASGLAADAPAASVGQMNAGDIERAAQAAKEAESLLISGVRTNGGNRLAPLPALTLEELVSMIDRARAECLDAVERLRNEWERGRRGYGG